MYVNLVLMSTINPQKSFLQYISHQDVISFCHVNCQNHLDYRQTKFETDKKLKILPDYEILPLGVHRVFKISITSLSG